jgi:hypothetical protein
MFNFIGIAVVWLIGLLIAFVCGWRLVNTDGNGTDGLGEAFVTGMVFVIGYILLTGFYAFAL